MKYCIEATIYTTSAGLDPAIGVLMDHEIESFLTEDPDEFRSFLENKQPHDWDYVDDEVMQIQDGETKLTFYCNDEPEDRKKIASIKQTLQKIKEKDPKGLYGRLELRTETIFEEDWSENWKAYFKPAIISDSIGILPSWIETFENPPKHVIRLDPGMAFGTGTHPTTSMCVKLLEKYIEPEDIVLDIGSGSGVLSMAAALLGARHTYGVDVDEIAVSVGKENIAINHLSDKVTILEGDLTKGLSVKGDVVAANLSFDLILLLAQDIKEHLQGKGLFILSGILLEKQQELADQLSAFGFHVVETMAEGDWCAMCLKE